LYNGLSVEKSRNVPTNIAGSSEASQFEADFPILDDAGGRPLVAVAGPTGSGKSGLALAIAAAFDGEVVNCDSLQVYRYFDIGSGKLTIEERRGIAHHLMDVADPDELFTAGEYARLARIAIAEISGRGKLPVVAGGTGFYLRALLDGLFEGPVRDQTLRDRLAVREARRAGSLHRLLRRLDAESAAKIHANDVPKVTRALEVCLVTRRPVSQMYREGRDALRGYRTLKIGLWPDRDALCRRADARLAAMFEGGLLDEVKRILAMGYAADSKPFESHGYKQALQCLNGELNQKEAVFYAQRNIRKYAKRQMTWFRKEADLEWLKGFGEAAEAEALERVGRFLSRKLPDRTMKV
jgi:tRNA dimethylallyltransferase